MFSAYFERRKTQLENQKHQDDIILYRSPNCDKDRVIRYLLKQRATNRERTHKVMNESFLNFFRNTENALDLADEEYKLFRQCIAKKGVWCECIEE